MNKPDKKRLKRDRRIAKKLGFKPDKSGHPIAAGYPNPGIYILGDEYSRRYSGEDRYALNGNSVELQSYGTPRGEADSPVRSRRRWRTYEV